MSSSLIPKNPKLVLTYSYFCSKFKSIVEVGNMFIREEYPPQKHMALLSELGEFISNFTLSHPNVKALLKREKHFDAIIVEVFFFEALYGLAAHYNCPLIGSSTFSTSKWTNDLTKAPMEYAYVPHNFVKLSENMNFWQRTYNMLICQYENIFMEFFHYKRQVREMDQVSRQLIIKI